jgi:hypothetical protein
MLPFTPAPGTGGRREIVALVSLGGVVGDRLIVARYLAPPTPVPSRPPTVTATRLRGTLVITWGPSANATGYTARVGLSDGRRILFTTDTKHRVVRIGGFAADDTGTVAIAALSMIGQAGPVAAVTIRPQPLLGPVRGLRARLRGRTLAVSWRNLPGARRYEVRILIRKIALLTGITGSTRVTLRGIKAGSSLEIAVNPIDNGGRPGASVTLNLHPRRRR